MTLHVSVYRLIEQVTYNVTLTGSLRHCSKVVTIKSCSKNNYTLSTDTVTRNLR